MQSLSTRSMRILNFDSAITSQKCLLAKYSHPPYSAQIIDLLDYGPSVREWINKREALKLSKELNPADRNKITLYGSGDFHHVSALLIDKFGSTGEDFCVVIFDFHPDLDKTFPKFSCGSWVNLIAKKDAVKKIVMLGPSSDDLSFPHNLTFNFSYFKSKRIELYPFYHKPSLTLSGRIVWENLRGKDIRRFMADLIDRLPSKNVYISIDKDCLTRDYAVTNWEEGVAALDLLLDALKVLKDKANIIGMDITGDYSPIRVNSLFKRLCTMLDHPRQSGRKMDAEEVARINEETNLKILRLFL
jgi:arginase family enzyme